MNRRLQARLGVFGSELSKDGRSDSEKCCDGGCSLNRNMEKADR